MNSSEKLGHTKVFRYDPETDKEPRYEEYLTPVEGCTVLDVLRYIYENYDPTLSFRFGCDGAGYERCGACAVLVNGVPAFSCKKVAEKGMTIAPHPGFEVVKDLIVDFDKQREKPEASTASVTITVDPQKCDGCRDCVLICPSKVYEIQKKDGKGVSVPVNVNSCLGLTCIQCSIYCKNSAIKVEPIRGEK